MLWNDRCINAGDCTGQHTLGLQFALRDLKPGAAYLDAQALWTAAGGPLDAPDYMPRGGVASRESWAYPGKQTAFAYFVRPGTF